jgi:hypothetical protein
MNIFVSYFNTRKPGAQLGVFACTAHSESEARELFAHRAKISDYEPNGRETFTEYKVTETPMVLTFIA